MKRSSASQMTAAKVVDMISILPGCAGQAADGQGDGIPKAVRNRRRRTREGPEPARVQTPFLSGVAHAGVGRAN